MSTFSMISVLLVIINLIKLVVVVVVGCRKRITHQNLIAEFFFFYII